MSPSAMQGAYRAVCCMAFLLVAAVIIGILVVAAVTVQPKWESRRR